MTREGASGRLLNLGCGARFHPAWTNVDFVALDDKVIAHDLRHGIPFADETYDVVYHSHVLEHFGKERAPGFLSECHRVLRPGGILRVVVPDLEQIARLYLHAVEAAAGGSEEWQQHLEWLLLEMYDQAIRERPGGQMLEYLMRPEVPNAKFVLERVGAEAGRILEGSKTQVTARPTGNDRQRALRRHPLRALRELILRAILGGEYECLRIGRFRRGGEVHLWMYDRFSLCRLLEQVGFSRATVLHATESQIRDWQQYRLDIDQDGNPFKPDSLYVEARKP